MGHSINTDKPPGKPPTISQSGVTTQDQRLGLRWGVMFKGFLIMSCRLKSRAVAMVEAGNRGTPGGKVTLKDFNVKDRADANKQLEPKP